MSLVVDFSHVHRPTTGIERVSLDLFSAEALTGLDTVHIRAASSFGMIWAQWGRMPLRALFHRGDIFACPGFPPSIPLMLLGGRRVIPYIHDLFLMLRKRELNTTAKYYMRPSFQFAIRFGRHFLVNSQYTQAELKKYCRADAEIRLFRPPVADVFGLAQAKNQPAADTSALRLVAIGTVEPRKNLRYAARIRENLEARLGRPVELHLVGRAGWGGDVEWLAQQKSVIMHGYCPGEKVRQILRDADIFLSTSLEEGLGLPLLEVQHGGKCVAASDIPVYHEVLGASGLLVPLKDPGEAAGRIAAMVSAAGWKDTHAALARVNVAAWNAAAARDKSAVLVWLAEMQKHG